jgi:hypothetical protein
MNGRDEKCIQNFGQKSKGMRLLVKPSRRQNNNTEMVLKTTGWDGVDWTHTAQHSNQWQAVVKTAMNRKLLFLYNLNNY